MKRNFLYIILLTLCMAFASQAYAGIPVSSDSRIKTLVYSDNDIFRVVIHYGYQTNIEFARGEEIETLSIGQPHSWKITPLGNRVFIKALEGSAHTNMTIITNRRIYFFELESKDPEEMLDEELAYVVRFYYPPKNFEYQQLRQFSSANITLKPLAPEQAAFGGTPPSFAPPTLLSPTLPVAAAAHALSKKTFNPMAAAVKPGINFRYTLTGPDALAPIKVFDDGKRTYLQFPNDNAILPYIYTINADATEQRSTYVREKEYIAVNGTFKKIALRLHSQEVMVYNEARQ